MMDNGGYDFSNVNIDEKSYTVETPSSFHGSLKEY